MRHFFFCLFLIALHGRCFTQRLSIVPEPVSFKSSEGMFQLSQKTVIVAKDEEDKKAAQYFNDYLQNIYGLRLDVDKQESKNYIRLITRKITDSTYGRRPKGAKAYNERAGF